MVTTSKLNVNITSFVLFLMTVSTVSTSVYARHFFVKGIQSLAELLRQTLELRLSCNHQDDRGHTVKCYCAQLSCI